MAVEIKELIIKAIAIDDNRPEETSNPSLKESSEWSSKIVQQCVKEVLKIMERKNAR